MTAPARICAAALCSRTHSCHDRMQGPAPRPMCVGGGRGRLYGLDACSARGLLIAGDTRGCLHLGDARAGAAVGSHQVHKKGNKARAACLP